MNFGQVLTAMVTPFDENGEIDFQATKNLINYLIANGTEGLVVSGTTGESPTLTEEEKIEFIQVYSRSCEWKSSGNCWYRLEQHERIN